MISIVIRTKNEERWIGHCLDAVFSQNRKDFEIILVDNESTDRTLKIVNEYDVRVMTIKDFIPGKAINLGIEAASGEYIVLLSGHCVPTNKDWLGNLVNDLKGDNTIAGIYGRQEPLPFTSDFDKRDLLITFGLDKKVQKNDSFFHNANSVIRKSVLDEIPISNTLTNIEDRAWANEAIKKKYTLIYEPIASVFHHHGIHHNQNPERCRNIVRILENLDLVPSGEEKKNKAATIKSNNRTAVNSKVDVLIPIKGVPLYIKNRPLLEYTIKRAKESDHINNIFVLTDNSDTASLAECMGAKIPFIREDNLSKSFVDIETVILDALTTMKENNISVEENLLILYPTNPFRPRNFINHLIEQYFSGTGKINSLIAVFDEHEPCWKMEGEQLRQVDEGLIPREFKKSLLVGIQGLGIMTNRNNLSNKNILGNNTGLIPISDPFCRLEVRDVAGVKLAEKFIDDWWDSEGVSNEK